MNIDFSKTKVLVIGDLMLDHYIIGESNRMSPEAPVPVIVPIKKYSTPGGAANVALNLFGMKTNISCIGIVGNDLWGKELINTLNNHNIDTSGIIISESFPTTLKKRIYLNEKQLIRIDEEKIDYSYESNIKQLVSDVLKNFDVIILSDYNKGVLSNNVIKHVLNLANQYHIPVVVDPKKDDFSSYRGANIVTPNLYEFNKASNIDIQDENSIILSARDLIKKNKFEYIVLTKGEKGMTIIGKDFKKDIEANYVENSDVTGAGDTVVSVLAVLYSQTKDIELSAYIANIAAAHVVSKTGTAYISLSDLELHINNQEE